MTSFRLPTITESTSFSTSSPTTREMSSPITPIAMWSIERMVDRSTTMLAGTGIHMRCAGSMTVTVSRLSRGTPPVEPGSKLRGLMALSGLGNSRTSPSSGAVDTSLTGDYYPEYVEADMFSLKTLDLWAEQEDQTRQFSSALACLVLTYCFWMAYADIDGFRIDAVKHMGTQAVRAFCDSIREFAESIGKERFLLVGEIGGGREKAWEIVQQTGLDAALGIDDVPGKLERMVCGQGNPEDYFSVFQNWILDDTGQHRWYRNKVVTLVDDHDQVRKGGSKMRFCGNQQFCDLAFNVVATQLTTMGIPCIYYGTEQDFDSGGRPSDSDLVLRETMFGGNFGGKCTREQHFFDESGALYEALSKLVDLRKQLLPLRRGRQMLHQVSGDGINFGFPRMMGDRMLSIVAWSRIFVDQEVLVAFSTNHEQPLTAYSTVASRFRSEGDRLNLIFWHAPRPETAPPTELLVENRGGVLAVHLTLPPAGFVIYQAPPGRQSVASRRSVVKLLQRT